MTTKKVAITEVLRFFLSKWKLLMTVGTVFAVIGIVIAYTTPEEWGAKVELMPEQQQGDGSVGNGSLKRLAGLAGVNIGSESSSTINPMLYPEITSSYVFLGKLLNEKFYFSTLSDSLTLKDYMVNHSKSSLVDKVKGVPGLALTTVLELIKGKKEPKSYSRTNDAETELLYFSKEEKDLFVLLGQRISVKIDEFTGVVSVYVLFQDPVASAMIVNFTKDYIANYVSHYNSEKEMRTLSFLKDRLASAEAKYKKQQLALSNFQDRNLNLLTERSRSQLNQLQKELDFSFNLYSSLVQQVQQSELTVEEKKIVFTVLKPTVVPIDRSEPNRVAILLLSIMLGVFFCAAYLFYKKFM